MDKYLVGISGGKDSTALALWMRYHSKLPLDSIEFQFADTHNEDHLTYAYLNMLEGILDRPIVRLEPEYTFLELAVKKKRWPGAKSRFCTEVLKIHTKQRALLDTVAQGYRPVSVAGSRHDEGTAYNTRGSLPEYTYDAVKDKATGNVHTFKVWYPIRRWKLADVIAIHRQYIPLRKVHSIIDTDPHLSARHKAEIRRKVTEPMNPLYFMGARRVGCFPCIMSRKAEIRAMAKYRPERIDQLREWEMEVGKGNKYDQNQSTLFANKTTPIRFHDLSFTIDGEQQYTATGDPMTAPSIDAVVQWSKTKRGGRQYEFEWADEETVGACLIGKDCE